MGRADSHDRAAYLTFPHFPRPINIYGDVAPLPRLPRGRQSRRAWATAAPRPETHSPVVEHSASARQVPGSNPGGSFFLSGTPTQKLSDPGEKNAYRLFAKILVTEIQGKYGKAPQAACGAGVPQDHPPPLNKTPSP